jgi:hypothetical protein
MAPYARLLERLINYFAFAVVSIQHVSAFNESTRKESDVTEVESTGVTSVSVPVLQDVNSATDRVVAIIKFFIIFVFLV